MNAWDRNRIVENQWHSFFSDYLNGRMRICEFGPKAGFRAGSDDIAALGIYSDDFPHSARYRRAGRWTGYGDLPLGREVVDGDDWTRVQKGFDTVVSLLPDGHAMYIDDLMEELRTKQSQIDAWFNSADEAGRRALTQKISQLGPVRSRPGLVVEEES
ncbi:MAG TPA: hypothetical protein VNA15_12335 [Candidatus Angelobacter sp.]|nr:hypothetical protein [Candidatus Angelobacter sp.]